MSAPVTAFLEATVRTATPLVFAGLGETLVEQAGVINVGLEGIIIAGAFGALVGATIGGVGTGFVAAATAGAAMAAVFALFATILRADQIISGTAVTLLGLGVTGALYRWGFGSNGAALTIPTMHAMPIPGLRTMPLLGPALFDQPPIAYAAYLLVPAVWWWTYRTYGGLALRAVGENPDAARGAGVSVRRVQFSAVIVGGLLGGVSGGTLVLAQVGTFAEGMSAGRGFIAIAIVALGRWNPIGAAVGAVTFGAASALQFLFQAMGWRAPYQLFLALPYVLTLVALAFASAARRGAAPAALGKSSD
jgi:general nucleoside transport system permease protein